MPNFKNIFAVVILLLFLVVLFPFSSEGLSLERQRELDLKNVKAVSESSVKANTPQSLQDQINSLQWLVQNLVNQLSATKLNQQEDLVKETAIEGDDVKVLSGKDLIEPGKFIIKFKKGTIVKKGVKTTGVSSIDKLNEKNKVFSVEKYIKTIKGIDKVGLGRIHIFYVDEKADIFSILKDYQLDSNIEYAEPVSKRIPLSDFPNDPYFDSSGTFGNSYLDQYWIHLINAEEGWRYATGSGVTIGLSNSFNSYHPELIKNSLINLDEIPFNNLDDDNDGRIDNYYYGCRNTPCESSIDTSHGTSEAGIILADTDNSQGIASIAFGAKIFYDPDFGFRVNEGAKIMSHSWALRYNQQEDLLEYAYDNGVVTFVAAGNNNAYSTSLGTLPTTINVGSVGWWDERYWSSGFGDTLDVMAPGTNVLTAVDEGGLESNSNYGPVTGTSFAAPMASGLGALLLSYNPSLTPGQVRYIILNSADDKGDVGWDQYNGYGRINIGRAFEIVRAGNVPSWDFESRINYPRYGQALSDYTLNMIGTAQSPNFIKYDIELCDAGQLATFYVNNFNLSNCRIVFTSNQQVVDGVLASLDLLSLGLTDKYFYFLKLKISDSVIPYYKPYITSFGFSDPRTCADTDGGKSYSTQGTVTATNSSGTLSYQDTCITSNNLKEYYCNASKTVSSESYYCTYGCSYGKCNPNPNPPPSCYTDPRTKKKVCNNNSSASALDSVQVQLYSIQDALRGILQFLSPR